MSRLHRKLGGNNKLLIENNSVQKLEYDGKVYAIVISKKMLTKGTNFFTPSDFPLQIGSQVYEKGYSEPAHFHSKIDRKIECTHQVVFVLTGKIRFTFFNRNGTQLGSTNINAGDIILLTDQGHKMTILENASTITVKQGPYLGEQLDKCLLKVDSNDLS